MDEEFDDTKYSSIYEMRICATVKGNDLILKTSLIPVM